MPVAAAAQLGSGNRFDDGFGRQGERRPEAGGWRVKAQQQRPGLHQARPRP